MADGMIVNYTHEIPHAMLNLIHAHHAPAVWLNAKLAEDCVYPDDLGAAHAATKRLIELGHRRIAFVHFVTRYVFSEPFEQARPKFHYSVADREAGYLSALREAGLKAQFLQNDRYTTDEEQIDVCRSLLRDTNRPTALLLYSEREVSALMCMAAELGLSVARDLSVVVFAAGELFAGGKYISTMQVPT